MNNLFLVWTARAIALLWASWWTVFAVGSALVPPGGPIQGMVAGGIVAVVFFGSALFAFKFESAGGLLLIMEGLFFAALYPIGFLREHSTSQMLVVLTTLALPPLVSGLLLYRDSRYHLDHPA